MTALTDMDEAVAAGRSSWPREARVSIFIDKDTRLVVQGITGRDGSFHAKQMMDYGTKVVAGVTPGKGGQTLRGHGAGLRHRGRGGGRPRAPTPRSSTCRRRSRPTPSSRRPTPGVALVVCITEGVPVLDMTRVMPFVREQGRAADRPELSRAHHPGRGQGRHHAGPDLRAGPRSGWSRAAAR